MTTAFLDALVAPGPHPLLGDHADTYGRLIGSWEGEVHDFPPGSPATVRSVEVHFCWVLEGRAVQDLWISPRRRERPAPGAPTDLPGRYGTTLRVFRPERGDWHVTWLNPVSGVRCELVGRREGERVVQVGLRAERPIRWTFVELTPERFLWQGHVLEPDGETWRLESEFRMRRTG
jgi:hypothetical protein